MFVIKHDISEYYVGKLYIGEEVDSLLNGSSTASDYEPKKQKRILESQGAIDFTKETISKDISNQQINTTNNFVYSKYICLFRRAIDEVYFCVENEKFYNKSGKDYYKDLVLLSELLPKVDYEIPQNISSDDALKLFNLLFKNPIQFYRDVPHSILDFYAGQLSKCDAISKTKDEKEMNNLPQKYLLTRSGISVKLSISLNQYYENDEPRYDYSTYLCLFLKHPLGVINLFNHQIYTNGTMFMEPADAIKGQDQYDFMSDFNSYLERNQINMKRQSITIPKALKLFKKAYNKKY